MKQKVTRFALTLLVSVLTATTAWADNPLWLKSGDSWDETTKTLTVNTATVAQYAYRDCTEIEHVIISNNVTVVFNNAFQGCTNLKSVFLGSGVSGLYPDTFNGCTSLKSVVITKSSSVLQLASDALPNHDGPKIYVPKVNGNILAGYTGGQWASYYNSGKIVGYDWTSGTCALALNNNGVMSVGGIAMADTAPASRGWKNSIGNITSVVIEDGVTHIGDNAFFGCSNMESITIPASVMSIGDDAFYSCGSLATITVDANNQVFDSRDSCNAIIRKADNTLILGCKTTVIPASVTSIGASAFSGCSGLTTISIPDGVTSIGTNAFYGCSGLTTVSIPNGVQSIGYSAFSGCSNLESVHISSGVSSIGESAFNNCDKLATITVDVNNQTFDSPEGSNAIIRTADNTLVAGCKTTVIPNSVTSIGDQAFWGHDGLTSITIPNSVTSIGMTAFIQCHGLRTVTIGSGVTSIGGGAFMSCDALESVTIYATSVPTLGSDVFWGNKSGRKIFVPTASLSDYKAAWGTYANDILPVDWEGAYAGTEDDPYMIYSTDHLLKLAYRVNGTHGETANNYQGKYFKLGADIAFTYDPNETDDYDENYEAIGGYYNSDIRKFNGNFNGDGHTVSGIRLRKTGTDIANDYQGLFGEIGSNAIIHDVHVTDARIKGRLCVGGIVGYSYEGTVRNCTVTESDITATSGHYGTICGFNSQGIFNHNYYRHCTVNGTANATNVGCMGADITDTQGAIPAFLVTLGDDATIETAMAADLGFSYGGKNYWRTGAELTLGHANRDGYAFIGYTVTDTGSNPVSVTENNDVYTFTMPASDVTVTANLIEKIPYIDKTGKTVDCTNYTVLNNTMTTISAGWYVVKSNVTFSDDLSTNVSSGVDNTVNIILCDGARLTANNITPNTNYDRLCIYGQSQGTGTANISGNIMGNHSISIYGGTINATGNIICPQGSIGIYGGTVTAGSLEALNTGSQIRLGGATVTAGSYNVNGNVTILPGKTYYDGTEAFYTAGNLGADQITAIKGKTLVPVTLSGTCGVDDPATSDVDESQNVTWLYDISTHTLTISGTGDMAEYASTNDVPWATYKASIITAVISVGVTTINSCAFNQGTIINLSYTGTIPDGYTFGGYTVTDAGSNPVSVTENNDVYTFTMPASDVTVNLAFDVINWATVNLGTEADPYIIYNKDQLDLLATNVNAGNNYSGKYFKLGADIAYSHTTDWDDASSTENNYTAIGGYFNSTNCPFMGTFDGDGHTISGIRIYKGGNENEVDEYLGLFGLVQSGTVKNVTITDMRITGYYCLGGIVGNNDDYSRVENCHATATVALNAVQNGAYNFGGIVGYNNQGNIIGCFSAVTITTTGTLTNCHDFGGIVGRTQYGSVRNCLAVGVAIPDISYKDYYNDMTASGAIAGSFDGDNNFQNYYSGCTLGGTPTASGIGVGWEYSNNKRHDVTANNGAVPATLHTLTLGEGITASGALINQSGSISVVEGSTVVLSYSGSLSADQIAVFSLNSTALGGNSFTMPAANATVSASTATAWGIDGGADGSAAKPYVISRCAELDLLATNVNGGNDYESQYFVLANDIAYNPNGVDANGENYTAIGDYHSHPFKGTFDGQGYTISGIRINSGNNYQGLFSYIENGTVKNITLADASITGYDYVGGIASMNNGTIENCLVIGTSVRTTKDNGNGGVIVCNNYWNLSHNYYSDCERNGTNWDIGACGNDEYQDDGAVYAIILSETATMPTMYKYNTVVFRRTFTQDVASTVCLPFAIDATQAAAAGKFYTFAGVDKSGSEWEVIMQEANPLVDPPVAGNEATTLTANTPYLFMPAATGPVLFYGEVPATVSAGETSDGEGWTFHGTYEKRQWDDTHNTDEIGRIYGFAAQTTTSTAESGSHDIQAGNFIRIAGGPNSYALPFRAYLKYEPVVQNAPRRTASELPATMTVRLVSNIGGTTAVTEMRNKELGKINDGWFTLDGRKLDGKPSAKGVYINNGRKTVIK